MLQTLVSVLIGFVLMMLMVVCFLTVTFFLLTIVSWVADGASRIFFAGGPHRSPDG